MKLSRKFVSDYIDIDPKLTIKDIAEDMTNVGNEYDSAEKLINCTNLVIGQVIKCCMHPDSDHLHVCNRWSRSLQKIKSRRNCCSRWRVKYGYCKRYFYSYDKSRKK